MLYYITDVYCVLTKLDCSYENKAPPSHGFHVKLRSFFKTFIGTFYQILTKYNKLSTYRVKEIRVRYSPTVFLNVHRSKAVCNAKISQIVPCTFFQLLLWITKYCSINHISDMNMLAIFFPKESFSVTGRTFLVQM